MEPKQTPADPAPSTWGPWFCALAMGVIAMNLALVTVVPLIALRRPFSSKVIWDPLAAPSRAMICLGIGFVLGAGVGLFLGLHRKAAFQTTSTPQPPKAEEQ
jgi:hypothetical protein